MKRLIIVRHAKAGRDNPRLKDLDRPLNDRGESDAPEMGRRLARRALHVDALLTSPARRALDTAKLIARELDFPWDAIRREARIYEAGAEELLEVVRETDARVETLLVVGHNPGVTELARTLARDFRQELPTSAMLAVEIPADTWRGVRGGSGSLLFFDFPKRTA